MIKTRNLHGIWLEYKVKSFPGSVCIPIVMLKQILTATIILVAAAVSMTVAGQTIGITTPVMTAPPGNVLRPGHLGRETGDLERIIHFYHDLLGTGINGDRHAARPFWSSPGLIAFANTPKVAEFRAVILPIPGTAAEPDQGKEMTIEAIEFRNMERHQYVQKLTDIGGSHLVLILRDLNGALDRLQAEGVPIISAGATAVAFTGTKPLIRAVMVRDPDGYPVELMQQTPAPATNAPADSNIIGARISVTVADLEATEKLYTDLVGPELQFQSSPKFIKSTAYNKLGDTPGAEYRYAIGLIPGSPVPLEFVQYRNTEQRWIQPKLQDIGVAHILFMVKDLDVVMPRIRQAGLHVLAASGEPVFIAPKVRAVFVPDPNHFFMEFMERAADTD